MMPEAHEQPKEWSVCGCKFDCAPTAIVAILLDFEITAASNGIIDMYTCVCVCVDVCRCQRAHAYVHVFEYVCACVCVCA